MKKSRMDFFSNLLETRVENGARIGERLVGLALAGTIALNFPLLYLFSGAGTLFGIPSLYLYLFAVWTALIGLMAAIMHARPAAGRQDTGETGHVTHGFSSRFGPPQ